jgi:uncharacterized membrane protein YbhN (UPF0104 family)
VSPATEEAPRRRRLLGRALRVALSLLLLGLLARSLDAADAGRRIAGASPALVGLVLLLMTLEGAYGAYKWWVLLRPRHPSLRLWLVVRVSFAGNFTGQFLPGTAGMELMRIYGLSRATSDLATSFTSVLVDRIAGLAGLWLVVLAGALLDPRPALPHAAPLALAALAALALGCGLAASRRLRARAEALLRPAFLSRPRRWLRALGDRLDAYAGSPGLLARVLALAVGYTLLRVAVVMAAAAAIGIQVPPQSWLVVVPLVIFATQLPVSLGGLGVREAAFVTLLAAHGVPGEESLALSLLLGAAGLAAELPGAWFALSSVRPARERAPAPEAHAWEPGPGS